MRTINRKQRQHFHYPIEGWKKTINLLYGNEKDVIFSDTHWYQKQLLTSHPAGIPTQHICPMRESIDAASHLTMIFIHCIRARVHKSFHVMRACGWLMDLTEINFWKELWTRWKVTFLANVCYILLMMTTLRSYESNQTLENHKFSSFNGVLQQSTYHQRVRVKHHSRTNVIPS